LPWDWARAATRDDPSGLSVVGDLVISQIVTLYITPIIYLYLENVPCNGWPKVKDSRTG
jgi:hypothetical protein